MKRERAALVLGALGALVCLSVAELGGDPTPWKVGTARAHGVLGPLVRAADGVWDPGLLRAIAVLGGVVVVLAWIAVLVVRDRRWRCGIVVAAALAVTCALVVPATLLQIGLRDGTAPWFYTNDSAYQIELGGDLVLHGHSPYGRDYAHTGMERLYHLDGTPPGPDEQIVALGHFPYFPGMALFGAGARLLPSPFDDARFLVMLCTLALLPAAMLLRGPFPVRLAIGAVLAANPLSVRAAWFGTADAPAVLALVLAFACLQRRRYTGALALIGAAVILKQFAIVAAPFVLLEAWRDGGRRALVRPLAALLGVVLLPSLVFAAGDPGAFWDDTITFGASTYRVIGYGLAGILVNAGIVDRTGSYPFPLIALLTWLPVTAALLWFQRRDPAPWMPAAGFAASMFVLVFIARVFQTSYLIYPLAGLCVAAVAAARRPDAAQPGPPKNGLASPADVARPSPSVL
jgi:4-amino-4-deoxy-L-arabinose transferase-like glycosyltransferase